MKDDNQKLSAKISMDIDNSMATRHASEMADLVERCLEEAKAEFGDHVNVTSVINLIWQELDQRKMKREASIAQEQTPMEEREKAIEAAVSNITSESISHTALNEDPTEEEDFLDEGHKIVADMEVMSRAIYLIIRDMESVEIHTFEDGEYQEHYEYGCPKHGMGPGLDAFAGMVATMLMEERCAQAVSLDRLEREETTVDLAGPQMRDIVESALTKLFGVDMSSATPMKQAS